MTIESPTREMILEVENLHFKYDQLQVLDGVNLHVEAGSVAALMGANGVGKSTLLRVISGLLQPDVGRVIFEGDDLADSSTADRSRWGLCLIPEGRAVFRDLTVRENLVLFRKSTNREASLESALEIFPLLKERLHDSAGSLSGGQQQMLAVARAFTGEKKLILIDEASLGLAPIIVDEVFEAIDILRRSGVAMLIVEQYVDRLLAMAHRVFVMSGGKIVLQGNAEDLDREIIGEYYFDSPIG